ncbi:hypothetical protein AAVH_13958 [Aphelenchoides avenae]|nr:hypothetical protein AAVH_13958 [Aphelenchus avenae]
MQWGQFVAHDITRTVDFEDGRRYSCEQCDRASTCSRIPVSRTDNKYSQRCIEINATVPVCNAQKERYNENTAFIDASMIYGSSLNDSQTVRSGMWLRTERYRGHDLPVFDKEGMFVAGDSRQNIFIGLAALHTLFVRQHNRLASQLARMNPRWNIDRVFQETRKIIGAVIQKITYEEFLPSVLGPSFTRQLGRYRYNSYESNPQIKLEFSTASYRFGHGMIRSRYPLVDDYWRRIDEYPTTDAVFNNTLLLRYGIDAVLRGLLVTPAKKPQSMSRDVTERLFGDKDLASTNIQRGRDHYLPGYASVRSNCGLGRVRSFDDLRSVVANRDAISKLKQVYSNVDDIDLFVGSMLESPLEGALVGPTTACILRKQFQALRDGDRFFYENTDIFTPAQIREIGCWSLAAIICDNSDGLYSVPPDAFAITTSRSLQRCSRIQRPDLYQWKER